MAHAMLLGVDGFRHGFRCTLPAVNLGRLLDPTVFLATEKIKVPEHRYSLL
jgi:hypothetical protein